MDFINKLTPIKDWGNCSPSLNRLDEQASSLTRTAVYINPSLDGFYKQAYPNQRLG